ncbi:MAG: putative nucleotidyltransferase [Paraglaciecola sp.]|jgi:predicted nucleotidyltransferase
MAETLIQLVGSMNNILVDISGKLPDGLVLLYKKIYNCARALNIPCLVVGAMARDLVLVHGYGARIERGTRDVDFGIYIHSWQQFCILKQSLLDLGFTPHRSKIHQLLTLDTEGLPWEIDIIPFGPIAQQDKIHWPPKQEIEMSVLGFTEAYEHALSVRISKNPDLQISVASPAGMLLLKLISWQEREPVLRTKDAADIYYLLKHYVKIPMVFNAVYDDGFMEIQNWDETRASAMKLASDARQLASKATLFYLQQHMFKQDDLVQALTVDMTRSTTASFEECSEYITIVGNELIQKG